MDDVEEEVDIQNEINNMISKSVSSVDDAEIEAELAALLALEQAENIPVLPQVPISKVDLPDVPVQEEVGEETIRQEAVLA